MIIVHSKLHEIELFALLIVDLKLQTRLIVVIECGGTSNSKFIYDFVSIYYLSSTIWNLTLIPYFAPVSTAFKFT